MMLAAGVHYRRFPALDIEIIHPPPLSTCLLRAGMI